ncbi:flavin reductase family protein [Aliamphritea ceti]|uniref:flavin reductase family protein n=1 Tax=Aliamphritea ceti TaxID=1524258 RepID=UPI0021C45C78|nr:flavin reductase family protein [Aliamphritea ceti]
MNFNVSELGNQEKYRLLNGGVTPRPIAWISTCSKEGIDNLAPYSFFTVASCNPPVLLYTQVTQRSGIDKDTLQNLKDTGECVVNIVSAELLEKMNATSASIHNEHSEFEHAGVERIASSTVTPSSVKGSPVRYECTLREIISVGDEPASGTVVMLDVKSVYVRDDLYDDGLINQALIDSVGKMGGDGYSRTSDYLELERP